MPWTDTRPITERARIDEELAVLAPVILAALEDEDDGSTEADGHTLEACMRRTYAYSEEVVEAEAYLKDLRAAERANGTATATGYVRVTRSPTEAADRAPADAALAAEAFHRAA